MLNPPPHVLEFIGAMASDKALCDEFTTNFNHPDKQVDVLGQRRAHARVSPRRRQAAAGTGGNAYAPSLSRSTRNLPTLTPSVRISRASTCRWSRSCRGCGLRATG